MLYKCFDYCRGKWKFNTSRGFKTCSLLVKTAELTMWRYLEGFRRQRILVVEFCDKSLNRQKEPVECVAQQRIYPFCCPTAHFQAFTPTVPDMTSTCFFC